MPDKPKTAPVQGYGSIPWELHERAWAVYASKYGRDQSAERIAERHGFSTRELDLFIPGWRDEVVSFIRQRDEARWRWIGRPIHFRGAQSCGFHLGTIVGGGRWAVSTVGDYWPQDAVYVEPIGMDRLYETMVFSVERLDKYDHPVICPIDLDMRGANTARDAEANHMEMCRRWDSKEKP